MQISVASTTPAVIEGSPQARRLIIRNTGSHTVFFGYEDTLVATSGANQGVPLKADEVLVLEMNGQPILSRIRFICASGETSTINYTRLCI